MKKELLINLLRDVLLLDQLANKKTISITKKCMISGFDTFCTAGIDIASKIQMETLIKKYSDLLLKIEIHIEEIWGLTWQQQEILKKYVDYSETELELLPDYIYLT